MHVLFGRCFWNGTMLWSFFILVCFVFLIENEKMTNSHELTDFSPNAHNFRGTSLDFDNLFSSIDMFRYLKALISCGGWIEKTLFPQMSLRSPDISERGCFSGWRPVTSMDAMGENSAVLWESWKQGPKGELPSPLTWVGTGYSFFHSHGSGKWLYLKGNYYWRDPFFTFMFIGGWVVPED